MSIITIVTGCHGLLVALWQCRLWLMYSVLCVTVHTLTSHIVSKLFPHATPLLDLKPQSTKAGFTSGLLAVGLLFILTAESLSANEWMRAQPTAMSFTPFDRSVIKTAEGGMFSETRTYYGMEFTLV